MKTNQSVRDHITTLPQTFWFREGNSNPRKAAQLVSLALFAFLVVQIIRKEADITDAGTLIVWSVLLSTFNYLLGRNHEGEVRHRRKKRGDPEE